MPRTRQAAIPPEETVYYEGAPIVPGWRHLGPYETLEAADNEVIVSRFAINHNPTFDCLQSLPKVSPSYRGNTPSEIWSHYLKKRIGSHAVYRRYGAIKLPLNPFFSRPMPLKQ